MQIKRSYLKYAAIVLCFVIFITAALQLLHIWEDGRDTFTNAVVQDGVVTYQGKTYTTNENVESILVLGLDKYQGQTVSDAHESGVQTDFLMLLVFDNEAKQYTALHINRDTMTKVNKLSVGGTVVVDTLTKQIALAYNYVNDDNEKIRSGNTTDAVEYLLKGVNINHYLSVTMDAVPALNDAVGGVTLTVLDDFTGIDDTLVKGQTVTLKGEQALRYVRTRYGLDDSTNDARMVRQQQYIKALSDKVFTALQSDEQVLLQLIDTIDEYVVYDSSNKKMQKLGEKLEGYTFLGFRQLQGETKTGDEFVEFYPDEQSIWETVLALFYKPTVH